MAQEFGPVRFQTHDRVAVIALNHPATVNALSAAMMAGLHAAADARAIVLTGTGRGFCSGADLNELPQRQEDGAGATLERLYHPFLRRLRDCPVPVVTALNGAAVGIGVSLALTADLVVAAQSAYFLLGFSSIGLVPDGGATWLLPRLIGLARARDMALLAERLPAERALEWGLINRVAADTDLMETALALAARLADGPAALAQTRKLFWQSPHNGYEEQLTAEATAQSQAAATDDFQEGLAAFRDKRSPHFKGT